jgi:hypothetical protein
MVSHAGRMQEQQAQHFYQSFLVELNKDDRKIPYITNKETLNSGIRTRWQALIVNILQPQNLSLYHVWPYVTHERMKRMV